MRAAKRLARFLADGGLTQAAFAARVKVSAAVVCMWLSGLRRPGGWSAMAIERETGGRVPASLWPKTSSMAVGQAFAAASGARSHGRRVRRPAAQV